jgi:hypothetical protein
VTVKLPPIFTDPEALFKYQYQGTIAPGGGSDNMYETTAAHFKAIKEKYEMERIETVLKIGLPFRCSQAFDDPYNQAIAGYGHIDYPYLAMPDQVDDPANPGILTPDTRSDLERNTRVSMLHVSLKAADEHRQDFSPTGRRMA